ncbi:hypothetical protein [Parasitella parasitica]|uniref:Uncharacterized protein n=1 Tax=Parasitella parasitica TaxID=35722 RepID=A0A0B7NL83_9FUNG|nr:hypothetical protein [Parasitella parasitica]
MLLPGDSLLDLIRSIYFAIVTIAWNAECFVEKAKNKDVKVINDLLLRCDRTSDEDRQMEMAVDDLNTIDSGSLPPHNLELKVGTPVIVIRHIDPAAGICNDTRLVVSSLGTNNIEAAVATGPNKGDIAFISRIKFITLATEGQTLSSVRLYLPCHIFGHGQLYADLSRVRTSRSSELMISSEISEIEDQVAQPGAVASLLSLSFFCSSNNIQMGKWTDKLYITHSEWSGEVGQHSASGGISGKTASSGFKRLPFYCCSLSLQPFEHPVCTADGVIFDLIHIIPYIKKYGTNPVTGDKLHTKDLIKLNFHKNEKDEYHCPVTFKVFTDHTAIAAIKTTGNVFAYDTIDKLNIKAKHWRDLISDEPFTRKDIIMIQVGCEDPHNLEKRDMSKFDYLKTNKKVVNVAKELEKRKPTHNINVAGLGNTKKVFDALASKEKKEDDDQTGEVGEAKKLPTAFHQSKAKLPYNAAHYTTGEAAESFTSTAMGTYTQATRALIDEDDFMYKKIKSKSYARIITNYGNINVELFSDKVQRTCHNFVQLAKTGYYNGVLFHRNIKKFMIQGGDPTGTGRGGQSIWKRDFPDEIKTTLTHNARGVLSMANKGKDTNSSQFFITYAPAPQLDGKHTVFGKVVGGLDVLKKLEAIPVDEKDRPERDIKIKQIQVFVDPFEEYQTRLKKKLAHEANREAEDEEARRKREKEDKMGWFGPSISKQAAADAGAGVGKYLQPAAASSSSETIKKRSADHMDQEASNAEEEIGVSQKKLKALHQQSLQKKSSYGNFDNF